MKATVATKWVFRTVFSETMVKTGKEEQQLVNQDFVEPPRQILRNQLGRLGIGKTETQRSAAICVNNRQNFIYSSSAGEMIG